MRPAVPPEVAGQDTACKVVERAFTTLRRLETQDKCQSFRNRGSLGQRAASVRFLLRDRAGQFTGSFDAVFQAAGIRILASPPQAPRANAICERVIGTLRRELLDRLLIVNEHHLRRVLTEYLAHYNTARPHRALGQLAPAQADSRPPEINLAEYRIRRKQVLGGLTHEYQIAA